MNQIDDGTINYKVELIRKSIHICSLSIPVAYYFVPRTDAIIILSILSFLALIIDLTRYLSPSVGKLFYFLFGFLLRRHEVDYKKKNLNGATYVFLSSLACVIIFPKIFVITGLSILIISDTLAALIGRRFGKHKFLAKSREGTIAFFLSAVLVIFFTPKVAYLPIEYVIGIVASAVGAIVENISFGFFDDNLSIPMSIGFSMWGLYLLFLPDMNLILVNSPF